MKKLLEVIAMVAVGLVMGALLHECQRPRHENEAVREVVTDTVVFVDTLPYFLPEPVAEKPMGTVVRRLPVVVVDSSLRSEHDAVQGDSSLRPEHREVPVEVPIVQQEYEGPEYHAWVSGFEPRLDSILVFPRCEVVTIKQPPKRWHLGLTAGVAFTPRGFQPYAGIGVTYSIISR
ncbi:MAG: hypothetical protein HDS72_04455 [Bacteroidales bacterium]|nr:hypothetical protein [Bacteroidales bacterium]